MDSSKRNFLKLGVIAANALVTFLLGVPVLGYVLGPLFTKRQTQWVEAAPLSEFTPGEPAPKRIRFVDKSGYRETQRAKNVWVLVEGPEIIAYASECPHVGCNVVWKPDDAMFLCPCHGGKFDKNGTVLDGPPPRPLTRLATKLENGKVFIEV